MKHILFFSYWILSLVFFSASSLAQSAEDSKSIAQRYHNAALNDAEELNKKFQDADKPKYQKAYDEYWEDLEVIRKTGVAPDNEELYSDLREMNNEDGFVYSESKRGINQYRGRAF